MVPNIPTNHVQGAIVRVCLLHGLEYVVFRDEMSGDRMEAHAKQGWGNQIQYGSPTKKVKDQCVSRQDDDCVHVVHEAGLLRPDHQRADGVEQRLQQQPQKFQRRVREEPAFPCSRHVYVFLGVALELVVLHVISLEHCWAWNSLFAELHKTPSFHFIRKQGQLTIATLQNIPNHSFKDCVWNIRLWLSSCVIRDRECAAAPP